MELCRPLSFGCLEPGVLEHLAAMMAVLEYHVLHSTQSGPSLELGNFFSVDPTLSPEGSCLYTQAMFGTAFGASSFPELLVAIAFCKAGIAQGEELVHTHWFKRVGADAAFACESATMTRERTS